MEYRLTTLGSGRWWQQQPSGTNHHRSSAKKAASMTDSGQNSLEYWDYTVELEMLKGPEDLQLAAELGKTLLERNRELEASLRHQQALSDDRMQEIEYLSKQTAALREVNDSRLRIYEQLEVSIQELEKNNQRLSAEGASDKRRIKSLTSTLEALETRCEDLQRQLHQQQHQQQQQQQQQQQRGRTKRKSLISEEQLARRSQSCENTGQGCEEEEEEEEKNRRRLEEVEERLRGSRREVEAEQRQREELEIQLSCLSQENSVLQDQLNILRERDEGGGRSLEDELASLEDSSSSRLCRKCLGDVETASNPTLYDLTDSIEDTDISIDSVHGECALVRLKNGGYAWGSQESLASIGQVVSGGGGCESAGNSPSCTTDDGPHNSLLSELDTSYRILIEKYEALLEARDQQQDNKLVPRDNLVHPGVDELSGPMSLVMTDSMHDRTIMHDQTIIEDSITHDRDSIPAGKCHRCKTCTCDINGRDPRPKSKLTEEFSEVETSSSGFSDGESRLSTKSTQTSSEESFEPDALLTPTPKYLDLTSPVNPCDKRFQAAPEYKKLFQEIFTVLKKTVDENDGKENHNNQLEEDYKQNQQQQQQQQSNKSSAAQDSKHNPNQQQEQQQQQSNKSSADHEGGTTEILVTNNQNNSFLDDTIVEDSVNAEVDRSTDAEERTRSKDKENVTLTKENLSLSKENLSLNKEYVSLTKQNVSLSKEFHDAQSMMIQKTGGDWEGKRGTNIEGEGGVTRRDHHYLDTLVAMKPLRPDSLDLISNHSGGSRPSSRQRKKHKQKLRQALQAEKQQSNPQRQQADCQNITQRQLADSQNISQRQQADNQQSITQRQHVDNQNNPQRQQVDSQNISQQQLAANISQHHKPHRREMLEHHHQTKSDDLPNQNEGESANKTRVFYNSRCEHHRSRKHRQRRHLTDSETTAALTTTSTNVRINYPSVEVAKLRKLEMTYAQVLKTSRNSSHYNRY